MYMCTLPLVLSLSSLLPADPTVLTREYCRRALEGTERLHAIVLKRTWSDRGKKALQVGWPAKGQKGAEKGYGGKLFAEQQF